MVTPSKYTVTAILKNGLFTQMVSNYRFPSNLLQVIGRPSSYYIPVRKCVAPIVLEIQPQVKASNMKSTEICGDFRLLGA